MKGFRNRKSARGGAVRASKLDDTLEHMNMEMSEKMARAIAEYHTTILEPILDWLQTPWWKYKSVRPPNPAAEHLARKAEEAEKDIEQAPPEPTEEEVVEP